MSSFYKRHYVELSTMKQCHDPLIGRALYCIEFDSLRYAHVIAAVNYSSESIVSAEAVARLYE